MAKVDMAKSWTMAAATSSWVERGLEAQRDSSAPPAFRARARLAVSVVTWRQAERRRPFRGLSLAKRSRISPRTGISRAAHSIFSRPWGAREGFLISAFTILPILDLP